MARLLGVDLGEKRVGLAVSDPTGVLATPLRVLHVRSPADALRQVAAACAEVGAEGIVLGLPRNMDGTEGPKAREARAFAAGLGEATAHPVFLYDERLTTSLVERTLLDADVSRRRRREVRDKLAAQVILQSYLDAQC
jgi:putative Holliday junction resolvase